MKLQRTALSVAILAGLSFAGQSMAQDASAAKKSADDLDTVVVVGIRGAIEKSLDSKRDAESRIEVVTAEDIGKMPDHNVADSLQRVSGVNISAASANEGAFDENDRVSMRGTSPSFTQTLIDGHNIASGDWFVLNQSGTVGRSVSYSLLPSELVEKVEVHKSSEAKLVEGGAVGNVNIVTRRPLNFHDPITAQFSVGAVNASLPGKTDPQLSTLLNFTNQDRTIGLMLQLFSEERHLRRDGQEILGYERIGAGTTIATAHPDLAGVYYPTLIGSALFEQNRKRTGGLATLEFKPNDDLSLSVTGFMSNMSADNYNRNYMLWGRHVLAQGNGQSPDAGYVVRNNTLVGANFSAQSGTQYGIYDQISRPGAKATSNYLAGDFRWHASDKLKLSGQFGSSKGHGKTPTQDVAEWDVGLGSGAGWHLNGVGAADWNLGNANTGAPGAARTTTNPGGQITLDWMFGAQDIDVVDKEQWAKFDGEYFIDHGALSSIEFGARTASHDRSLDHVVNQGPGCINSSGVAVPFDWSQTYFCPAGTKSPFDPANWPTGYRNYPGNFGSGLGGNFPRNIWYFTPAQLAQFNALTNRHSVDRRDFSQEYGLSETSNAMYAQLNFQGEKWSGNFGLRYVRTEEKSANWVNTTATDPNHEHSLFGDYRRDVTKHTYNDFLPSLNFKYNISDNMLVRLAASRTMTRPDYSALAGSVALNSSNGTGSGGNPDLKPILSTNLDASFEWYYAPRALVSASLFSMNIDNYVGLDTVRRQYFTIDSAHPTGAMQNYDVIIPVGTNAKVHGFELAWEQPFGDHFGGFANYTYANGSTDAVRVDGSHEDMLGTSKNTYNVGGYFENDHFNARLNYTYRSSFYSGLDRASAFYQDAVSNVSASFGYKFNDNFTLALDALNLNNPKTKYYAESRDRPRSIYENGRQYYLTLRMKF